MCHRKQSQIHKQYYLATESFQKTKGLDDSYDPYEAAYGSMPPHAAANPDIIVEKKLDSPDEDKSLADSKAIIPVLTDFFLKHPLINPKTFLGDSAFDSALIYNYLLQEAPFEKAFIPLN